MILQIYPARLTDIAVESTARITSYNVCYTKLLRLWQFLKDKGFFGMIIPKKYGGLGFSASYNFV